jgi:hypothetical protein
VRASRPVPRLPLHRRLWEPNFQGLNKRLGPGTYWLSIYGTTEPDSPGIAHAISANEGAITSNSYRFRQAGFGWVDGGPFYGSAPRDLALEMDANCRFDRMETFPR